jgi:NADH:ubiquinone oxidoreductase subunit 6 (subunit J)
MQDAALFVLMYGVFPLWVAAGFADWVCHARTGIAITSGLAENMLHWLMYAEIAVGIAAIAYFELNAAVLGIVLAVFIVHEITVYGELRFSTIRRDVAPFEQMVHSFMELLPLVSLLLLALIAWPLRLDDLSLRPRQGPWPISYMAAGLIATFLFNVLPLLQETASCLRGRKPRGAAYTPRVEPHL